MQAMKGGEKAKKDKFGNCRKIGVRKRKVTQLLLKITAIETDMTDLAPL